METLKNIISGVTQTLSAPEEPVEQSKPVVESPAPTPVVEENQSLLGKIASAVSNTVKEALVAPDIGGEPLNTAPLSPETKPVVKQEKTPKLTVTEATPDVDRKELPADADAAAAAPESKGVVQQAMDMARDAGNKMVEKMEENFPNATEKAKELGQAAVEAVQSGVARGKELASATATQLKDKAEVNFPNATEKVKEVGLATSNAVESVKESLGFTPTEQPSAETEATLKVAKEPEEKPQQKEESKPVLGKDEPIAAMFYEKMKEIKEETKAPVEPSVATKAGHITADQLLKLIAEAEKQTPADMDQKLPKLTEDIAYGRNLHPEPVHTNNHAPLENHTHLSQRSSHPSGDERPIQQPNRAG